MRILGRKQPPNRWLRPQCLTFQGRLRAIRNVISSEAKARNHGSGGPQPTPTSRRFREKTDTWDPASQTAKPPSRKKREEYFDETRGEKHFQKRGKKKTPSRLRDGENMTEENPPEDLTKRRGDANDDEDDTPHEGLLCVFFRPKRRPAELFRPSCESHNPQKPPAAACGHSGQRGPASTPPSVPELQRGQTPSSRWRSCSRSSPVHAQPEVASSPSL